MLLENKWKKSRSWRCWKTFGKVPSFALTVWKHWPWRLHLYTLNHFHHRPKKTKQTTIITQTSSYYRNNCPPVVVFLHRQRLFSTQVQNWRQCHLSLAIQSKSKPGGTYDVNNGGGEIDPVPLPSELFTVSHWRITIISVWNKAMTFHSKSFH